MGEYICMYVGWERGRGGTYICNRAVTLVVRGFANVLPLSCGGAAGYQGGEGVMRGGGGGEEEGGKVLHGRGGVRTAVCVLLKVQLSRPPLYTYIYIHVLSTHLSIPRPPQPNLPSRNPVPRAHQRSPIPLYVRMYCNLHAPHSPHPARLFHLTAGG